MATMFYEVLAYLMSFFTLPMIWLLLSAGVLSIMGILLLKFGLWPRRHGDTPYCRKCGYNLTGTLTGVCSECGTTLTADAVVQGQRPRRQWVTATGVLMIVLACIPLLSSLRQVNWYHLHPTSWVMADFRSTTPAIQKKAWNELQRRASAGTFSQSQEDQFIALCLAEQVVLPTGSSFTADAIRYLTERWKQNDLSPAQSEQFFEQMVLVCEVKVTSARDGRAIYDTDLVMRHVSSDLGRTHDFWFRIRKATTIDRIKPVQWSPWITETISAFRHEDTLKGASIDAASGTHTLCFFVEVEVYADGPVGDVEASRCARRFRTNDCDTFIINSNGTVTLIPEE